jgi:D-glycero-alpha-D-manno-heptose-7-phosphate kinase
MNVRSKAPLRVSFAGGGTDVPPYPQLYGGCVLNATIDSFAWGSLRPRTDGITRIASADLGIEVEFNAREEVCLDGKMDLAKAVIRRLDSLNQEGCDIFLHSEAPPGSGLGSSSALVVSLVGLVREYKKLPLGNYELADTAYVIEREDLKISGGHQDQYAAAFGGFNFIEFEKNQVIVNPLRIHRSTINELEHNLLLCFTGTTRHSDKVIDDQTSRLVANEKATLAGLRDQKALAVEMKNALLTSKLVHFGELLDSAWHAKKKMSDRISTPQIDELYEEARKKGAIGGKVTGAGGGGYVMFYCEWEKKHRVAEQLRKMGTLATEFAFDFKGLQTWRTDEASAG